MKQIIFVLLSLFILSSCVIKGKTIQDVPTIQSSHISIPELPGIPGKALSVSAHDARQEPTYSKQVRAETERAVTEALLREGFVVTPSADNQLVITIEDHQTEKFKEGCVKLKATLTIPKKAKAHADSSSCFESKNPFGPKFSADITKAYEEALSLIFKNLGLALAQVPKN